MMIIRVLSIGLVALSLAAPAFAAEQEIQAPRAQEEIQAPVSDGQIQAPRVAEVNDELYQPTFEPA